MCRVTLGNTYQLAAIQIRQRHTTCLEAIALTCNHRVQVLCDCVHSEQWAVTWLVTELAEVATGSSTTSLAQASPRQLFISQNKQYVTAAYPVLLRLISGTSRVVIRLHQLRKSNKAPLTGVIVVFLASEGRSNFQRRSFAVAGVAVWNGVHSKYSDPWSSSHD